MAENENGQDKSFDPSQKRLEDAAKKGDRCQVEGILCDCIPTFAPSSFTLSLGLDDTLDGHQEVRLSKPVRPASDQD